LQRSIGNRAVAAALNRTDAGGAVDAGTAASDAAVDALDLKPKAKEIANKLKNKYPDIAFTSGKRSDVTEQADAMAGNVVKDRQFFKIYKAKDLAAKLQKWVNDHPEAKTRADISKGLADTMDSWTEDEKDRFSAHHSGDAFDIQPRDDKKASDIKRDVKSWAEEKGGQFLEKESGLVRWHVQVRE
jgi:hypothetical protein